MIAVVALASLAVALPLVAQGPCDPCHAELEFLRQQVATLDEARALEVSTYDLDSSAHRGAGCAECHSGFSRFPHGDATSTEPCASCHAEADSAWRRGIHAVDANADCAQCHGVHDVRSGDQLSSRSGIMAMRASCADCHFEPRIPDDDPHADSVSCSACHGPHDTRPASDPASWVHVLNQERTCGVCHDTVSAAWSGDAHAAEVSRLLAPGPAGPNGSGSEPPGCTSCHGSHGMLTARSDGPEGRISARCGGCHEQHSESFADSYHGQAGMLGAEGVATCYDCHSGHGIYPSSDRRSATSKERLLDTCQSCHERATEGFTRFQPHADHDDREKYPHVYWSYRLMTGLLVGVFTFFGIHSALWLGRTAIDRWSGTPGTGREP